MRELSGSSPRISVEIDFRINELKAEVSLALSLYPISVGVLTCYCIEHAASVMMTAYVKEEFHSV